MSEALRANLRQLEGLAAKLGMPVRYDAIKQARGAKEGEGHRVRGGLCLLRGKSLIVCDASLPLVDKVFVLAEVLSGLGVELLSLPHVVRKRVQASVRPARSPLRTTSKRSTTSAKARVREKA